MNLESNAENIQIENAGLVIVCHFLPSFFTKLALIKDSKFLSEHDAFRAIYLLDYIATGLEDTTQHNLSLNKIICNINPLNSIPLPGKLSFYEKKETVSLLTAVINNWEVLKNSSIEGLRKAFLQRSGELIFQNNRMVLKLERRPIDILLDKLPWPITLIKMPWMENPVYFDWV